MKTVLSIIILLFSNFVHSQNLTRYFELLEEGKLSEVRLEIDHLLEQFPNHAGVMFLAAQTYTKIYRNIQKYTKIYKSIQKYTKIHKNIHKRIQTYTNTHIKVYKNAQIYTNYKVYNRLEKPNTFRKNQPV